MAHQLLHRCLMFPAMLAGVVLCTFLLVHVVPGDPAAVMLGSNANAQQLIQVRHDMGLDRPLAAQLAQHVERLLQGDLGMSFFRHQPVAVLIGERLPATLELAVSATLLALCIGIPLGVAAALKPRSLLDRIANAFSQLGLALTVYWLAIVLVYVFSVRLNWLPAIGRGPAFTSSLQALLLHAQVQPLADSLTHLLLPSLAMGLQGAALLCRMVKTSVSEVLSGDYVRTARALGISRRRVLAIHVMPNALVPLLSLLGMQFGGLLGGAVLVEGIFGWPGLGQLAVGALSQRDFPLIQGVVLCLAVLFGAVNLVADLAYAIADPRVAS